MKWKELFCIEDSVKNKEVGAYFVKTNFRKDFRIIFLRKKIGFKKKLSKKVGGKTTVWLSWRKGKWVVTPADVGREDETGKKSRSPVEN
jgi:hypothetical protein